jgi:hypothetical protein
MDKLRFNLLWVVFSVHRTAFRLRTAAMGLAYRKLLKLGHLTDNTASKVNRALQFPDDNHIESQGLYGFFCHS